jgi:Cu(I)/Ag(I) efflux system protein CusF
MKMIDAISKYFRVFCLVCGLSWCSIHGAWAAEVMAQATESESADWTMGEIRKVDKSAGKVTIRHEDIQSLNMPAMTMAFTIANKEKLEGLKVGDKIQFKAVQEQGKLIVTDIQSAKS